MQKYIEKQRNGLKDFKVLIDGDLNYNKYKILKYWCLINGSLC